MGLHLGTRVGGARQRGKRGMNIEEDRLGLHDLVGAMVDRLPAILAEVGELLAVQQSDYAVFLAGG